MKSDYVIEFMSSSESEQLAAQILFCGEFLCQVKPAKRIADMKICFYDPILGNDAFKQDLKIAELREIMDEVCNDLIEVNASTGLGDEGCPDY